MLQLPAVEAGSLESSCLGWQAPLILLSPPSLVLSHLCSPESLRLNPGHFHFSTVEH